MRIITKLQILTTFFVGIYTISLLSVITFMIFTEYLKIEEGFARKDIDRVVNAMEVESRSLGIIVKDYAYWDETWDYVMRKNPDYIEKNLDTTACDNLGISLYAFFDKQGKIVTAMHLDSENGWINCLSCPDGLMDKAELERVVQTKAEFIRFNNAVLLIASSPIVKTNKQGGVAGNMLMGKTVDEKVISEIENRTGVVVDKMASLYTTEISNKGIKKNIQTGLIRDDHSSVLNGFITFAVNNGEEVLFLRTSTVRDLREQGLRFITQIIILFGISTVFFSILINKAYHYWVADPLNVLETGLEKIDKEEDFKLQGMEPLFKREDEIGHIASVIQQMNSRVLLAHETIRQTNDNLEFLVEERTADLARANSKLELFKKILDNTSEAVFVTDLEGIILDMNDAMCTVTGYSRDELIGKTTDIFKSGKHDESFYAGIWLSLLSKGSWQGELWDKNKDGSITPKWQSINSINDSNGKPINYVGVSSDITLIKDAENKLHHLAYYDPLTNLPNRMLFSDRLEHNIECAKRNKNSFGLLFIDLDRFKNVNDTLGHGMGDLLLIRVSERLSECIRKSDTLCRIGGDEFTLILEDLAKEENAGMVASEIVHKLSQRFEINGSEIFIGASIGIALFPKDGTDAQTMLRKADAAMYLAKEDGRGVSRYASGEMEKTNRSRLLIENKLHTALEKNEFLLHYQPQNTIGLAKPGLPAGLSGVEALIRWQCDDDVLMMPGDFLPIAEETGFIAPLGDWVLYQACCDAKKWLDMGRPVQVSVNVAARQFDSGNFVDTVSSVLEKTGLPAYLLKLEVTESGFMRNIAQVIDIMKKIQATGVSFAIDDFGTGYCSLQYLNRLPVDCLKIDKTFVTNMDDNHSGGDIVSAVVSMARAFNLSSIAEGVETVEQLEKLQMRGCEIIQGYLVSKPMPYDDFVEYLFKEYEA